MYCAIHSTLPLFITYLDAVDRLATNVIKDHETMDCPFLWKDSTDPRTVHRQAGRLGSLDIPNN
ncbi:1376_t:CDS:2 [Entrophospora sp. SA101]|nr:1376_t:CDS:2 [Entrophospora sp. SA101]